MPQRDRSVAFPAFLAIAATLCCTLTGCGFVAASKKSDGKPAAFVLIGHADVALSSATPAPTVGTACKAPAGFADVAERTQVTITDSSGTKVATGTLGAGVVASVSAGMACEFPFAVLAVPGGSEVYSVAVGNRPAQTFQAADLRTNTPAIVTIGAVTQ